MDLNQISYVPAANGPSNAPVSSQNADIIVMHSMECPPDDGHVTNWVKSLATPQGGQYYAHYYLGPKVTYRVAPLGRILWHCGNGNSVNGLWTLGVEQSGYASMDAASWVSSGVLNNAKDLVASLIAAGHGENRWLEPDQLKIPGIRGVSSHNNMRIAFGGTDHTDPGAQYPHDLLLAESPPPHIDPTGEGMKGATVVATSEGGYKVYVIYPSGTAVYLRTAEDITTCLFFGATDARNNVAFGTSLLRVSAVGNPPI